VPSYPLAAVEANPAKQEEMRLFWAMNFAVTAMTRYLYCPATVEGTILQRIFWSGLARGLE
jgi:hypothetical protein